MNIGSRLPMNPWLFIVLAISLTAIGALNIEKRGVWTGIADAAFLVLQLTWILQAGLYAAGKAERKSGTSEKRTKQTQLMIDTLISVAIIWSGMVLGFWLLTGSETGEIGGTPALPFVLATLLALAALFTLVFQAAKALCVAEEKNTGERIFVTCLLFLYLIIGAPFLFRRLKRLDSAES